MIRLITAALAVALVLGTSGTARAADAKDVGAILDKAVQALGGEQNLKKVLSGAEWKTKNTITIDGNDNPMTTHSIVNGLDHFRQEFAGEFGGNKIEGVAVHAGDKGWRKFGDQGGEMDKDALANQKRTVYLMVVPMTIVPLKGADFKAEAAGEEKVNGKPAAVVKVTGPDGKDFRLSFDQASGLPVKLVAKVIGFDGSEYTQETTYDDYKDVGGIKKAMKVHSKRDGEKFIEQQVTEFKVLDTVDPKTFAEPK